MDQDAMLVASVLNGDAKAFAELVARHQGRIVNVIYRVVGNRDVAVELAQDTFLKVYRGLASYNRSLKFSTWINRIALNCAIDHLRRVKNAPDSSSGVAEITNAPQQTNLAVDPLQDLVTQERNRLVHSGLQQLPIGYRVPLLLRFHQELSHAEIADLLGISVNSLKVRIHRGLNRLRELIAAMEEDEK